YSLFGRVLCFAVIGYLMEWKLTLPYWLTVVSAAVSVAYATSLPVLSEEARKDASELRSSRPSLPSAFTRAIASRRLMLLMFQGVVLFVLARVVTVNLFQPILGGKGFGVAVYGLVMAGITLVEAVGAARPGWMRRYFDDVDSVSVLSALMALSILFIPYLGQAGTLVLLGVFSLVTGLSYPIQRQVMNEAIPDPNFRATFLSLE